MYDFDTQIDRFHTNSLKWDVGKNELSMWVADMDFETAPEIIDALMKRARHGVFGYNTVSDFWYNAYINWWKARHGFEIDKDWLIFCIGVVPAISSIVRKLTTPAENVLVLTPVYNIFFNSIVNNGRNVLECPLKYTNQKYSIDFEDLEQKLANPQTTMMILCNPHNPIGKIWGRQTLEKIGELCFKHHVIVVSDEIHCDLTEIGKSYIPFASVNENCKMSSITCVAPTKSFNLAGLQTAAVIIPNEYLRNKVNRGLNTDEIAEPNSFAVNAAVAAYESGSAWLEELREYIDDNRRTADKFIKEEIPAITLVSSEATYLLWLDCTDFYCGAEMIAAFIREETGLYLSAGNQYGIGGRNFLRINIACSKATLNDGLNRLKTGISKFDEWISSNC